eukprot:Trichotokara_eunicae@DN6345_c2_g4_i1.p1
MQGNGSPITQAPPKPYHAANVRNLNVCRAYASIVSGAGAGFLGLTGIWGPIFYLLLQVIMSATFLTKFSKEKISRGFKMGALDVLSASIFTNVASFVLIWTLVYDIIYVY